MTSTTHDSPAQEVPNPRRWAILMAVMLASIMGPIDGSVLNVALPTLASVFRVDLSTVGWVTMAYLLVLGSLILTFVRLGDMLGFRRVLLLGIITFTLAALINFTARNAMLFPTPFYLEEVLQYSPGRVGLVLTVVALATFVVAPVAGGLSDRLGTQWLAFSGQVTATIALLLMTGLSPASRTFDVAWRLGLFGVGLGLFQSPNNSAVMGAVPRHRLGIGSGVLATVRNAGMVLGV